MKTHTIIYLFSWLPCMIIFITCYRLTFPIDIIFFKYKELNLSISVIAGWLILYFFITWKFLWLSLFLKNIFGGYSTSVDFFFFVQHFKDIFPLILTFSVSDEKFAIILKVMGNFFSANWRFSLHLRFPVVYMLHIWCGFLCLTLTSLCWVSNFMHFTLLGKFWAIV